MPIDEPWIRRQFPSLGDDWALFDNGGGSQILRQVLERMQDYLLTSNVQHGATYALSRTASARLREAESAMATLVNAALPSEVVMGGSTTELLRRLGPERARAPLRRAPRLSRRDPRHRHLPGRTTNRCSPIPMIRKKPKNMPMWF